MKHYFHFQEYPPGVILIPMGSRTAKPFSTTNLVVFAPENVPNDCEDNDYIACGDALIVDPGCLSEFHGEVYFHITSKLVQLHLVIVAFGVIFYPSTYSMFKGCILFLLLYWIMIIWLFLNII